MEKINNGVRKNQSYPNSDKANSNKSQVVSITYEEIGLFPRSFSRVLDRFFQQLFSDVDNLIVQEYRFYRFLFLTTLKTLFVLIFLPFFMNLLAKNYIVKPVAEYFWNGENSEIFLNSYQQTKAFAELHDFEEKLYFESLLTNTTPGEVRSVAKAKGGEIAHTPISEFLKNVRSIIKIPNPKEGSAEGLVLPLSFSYATNGKGDYPNQNGGVGSVAKEKESMDMVEQKLQEKILQLAVHYNNESIEAITNIFSDLLSFLTLSYLLMSLEIQINITKSFLLEVFFGLEDSKKCLLILLVTDLLVGYHSPGSWEIFLESLFEHYGLMANQTVVLLLVATLPVLLDVLFKYLIFRHLNRSSPTTVATYQALIE